MKVTILLGSPRVNGNTDQALKPFVEELGKRGANVISHRLYGKKIEGCHACRHCQKDWEGFGCVYQDDMQEIFDDVLSCDVLVLATPIYSWFCTAPMKAALDRLMYGMNKFYGEEKGPSLWQGKSMALLITCGYPREKGADLFIEGMRRYAKHSNLTFLGDVTLRDRGYRESFMTPEKEEAARLFAKSL